MHLQVFLEHPVYLPLKQTRILPEFAILGPSSFTVCTQTSHWLLTLYLTNENASILRTLRKITSCYKLTGGP